MNKKVAVIINNLTMNGVTNVIFNYLANIDKDGLKIDLIVGSPADKDIVNKFLSIGVKTYVLGVRKKNPVRYYKDLLKLLKKNKYDVFHLNCNSCTSMFELEMAKKAGIKNIIAHSHTSSCEHVLIHRLFKNKFNNLITYELACSEEAGKWLYKSNDYIILNNAIDTDKFKYSIGYRNKIRKQLNIKEDDILIGHVGYFIEEIKNQQFLLKILLSLSNSKIKLVCIGDGKDFLEFSKSIVANKLVDRVILIKHTDEIYKYYSAFDVFCLPSTYEGLPLVTVEAQCSGLLTIVSKNVSEDCKLTDSLVFESIDNANKWAEIINNYDFSDDRMKKSLNNIVKITEKSFDIKQEAKKLRDLYLS